LVVANAGPHWTSLRLVALATSLVAAPHSGVAATETNLGTLPVGQSLRHRMAVENKGAATFAITNFVSSCECLRILSFPLEISPSGTGEIIVELAGEKVGAFRYEVVVETTDPRAPRKSFFLDVEVVTTNAAGALASASVVNRIPWPARVPVPREQALYLPVADALAMMTNGAPATFVDVRATRAHENSGIPGSLHIAPHAVKSAGFLRSRTVVLVDEGWGNPALEAECRRLKELGFAARILRGGLNAWRAGGGALEPAAAVAPELAELQPRDYLVARRFDDWLVIDARSKAGAEQSPIPEAVQVSLADTTEKAFGESVAGLVGRRGAFTRVLVVGAIGADNPQMRRVLPVMPGAAVFFLAGGHQALQEQLTQGVALTQSRTERTGMLSSSKDGALLRKPCGRCP
jgi:rhodanese-related sulfurtransferase